MSQKQQLQVHNVDLSEIISKIDDLPLKELVEAAAREGQYVWKKSQIIHSGGTVSLALVDNKKGNTIQVTSANLDVRLLSNQDFNGIYGTYEYATVSGVEWSMTADTISLGIDNASYIYDASTGRIIMDGLYVNPYTFTDAEINPRENVLGYVVSDSSTAYPDGGEKDGYWYERVMEGAAGIDYGEVTTQSVNGLTVSHSLGAIPQKVVLLQKNIENYGTDNEIAQVFPVWNRDYSNGYLHAYVFLSGGYTSSATIGDGTGIVRTSETIKFPGNFKGSYIWIAVA